MWIPRFTRVSSPLLEEKKDVAAIIAGSRSGRCRAGSQVWYYSAQLFRQAPPRFVMFPTLFQCKDCGGFTGYRSRPKNFTERFLLPLLLLRPTRCGDCFKRTYQSAFVKVRPRRESKKAQGATA